jgi:hypothetical protein
MLTLRFVKVTQGYVKKAGPVMTLPFILPKNLLLALFSDQSVSVKS